MDPTIIIDEPVDVVAVFRARGGITSLCMPCKMRYKGMDIVLTELGLRHPTRRGKRMVHVFDMSDGANDYRLEFDAEALTWRLMAIIDGSHRALQTPPQPVESGAGKAGADKRAGRETGGARGGKHAPR